MAITGPSGFRVKRDFSRTAFWIEPPIVTILGYCLAWLINPDDPLTLQTSFPWLVLAPLLVGLRYGFTAAAFSTVMIVFMGWLYIFINDKHWHIPGNWVLGIFAVSLITGEFRDIWQRRLMRMEKASQYSQSRMKEFTRSYYLLQHSHAQLEQEVALADYSLQGAVQNIRNDLLKSSNLERPLKVFGAEFMDVFCEYGHIQAAALLEVNDNGININDPIAVEGVVPDLLGEDPLIDRVFDSRKAACVTIYQLANQPVSDPGAQVCIPLMSGDGNMKAMLVIYQTDLHNLQQQYLDFMSILAGWFADQLHLSDSSQRSQESDPSRSIFAFHLQRCLKDAEDYGVPGGIIAIKTMNFGLAPALEEVIRNHSEPLDRMLTLRDSENSVSVIYLLMPLQGQAFVKRYIDGFPELLATQFSITMEAAEVDIGACCFKAFNNNLEGVSEFFSQWDSGGASRMREYIRPAFRGQGNEYTLG